jgi:hypothetical protein
MVAMLALSFSGLDPNKAPGVMVTAVICGVIGYFYFKSAEDRHSKAFARALQELESSERYRLRQAEWSEADRAKAVVELRALVDKLVADHPHIDPAKLPVADQYPSTEAARLVGYLMDLGKAGVISSAVGDQQMARYGFLDVIPVHSRPGELLRKP